MRIALPFLVVTLGCGSAKQLPPDPVSPDAGDQPDSQSGCAPSYAGAPCVLAAYEAATSCDPTAVATLRRELDAHADLGPLWVDGRALFRTAQPASVAGDWNGWSTTALVTAPLCDAPDLVVAVADVPTGYHPYKLVTDGTWSLDPANPAFAYDDFEGNADGENSVLNTPDSGRGHVARLGEACSTALGNCRGITAYYPAGYTAATNAATYPVLFLHDGQNVWSDHDCCFGHTGWEVDTTLDVEIAAGRVAPIVVIAADNTPARTDEYGLSFERMMTFIDFQVNELQPAALAKVRGDASKVFVGGSSLGGLLSMELALRHPDVYAGAASLSGAFWPNQETNQALRDHAAAIGKQPLAIYLDHGGNVAENTDGAADSVEVRDLLVAKGWHRQDSPSCTPGPDALCYYMEPGATHDELAWKSRFWRVARFLFPGS